MPNTRFHLLFQGALVEGVSHEEACARLTRFLSFSEKRADALLSMTHAVLKHGLSADKAKAYASSLRRLGLVVQIEPEPETPVSSPAPKPSRAAEPPKEEKAPQRDFPKLMTNEEIRLASRPQAGSISATSSQPDVVFSRFPPAPATVAPEASAASVAPDATPRQPLSLVPEDAGLALASDFVSSQVAQSKKTPPSSFGKASRRVVYSKQVKSVDTLAGGSLPGLQLVETTLMRMDRRRAEEDSRQIAEGIAKLRAERERQDKRSFFAKFKRKVF
jgi:hypothetical protein